MTERERFALREFQQFEQALEAEARAQAYEAQRPQREAGQHIIALRSEVNGFEREKILGKRRDPQAFVDDYSAEIDQFATDLTRNCYNREQIDHFKEAHPGVWTPELSAIIGNYFAVNHIGAASYLMLKTLVDRIRDAGLMPQRKPVIKPTLAVTPAPKQPVRMAPPVQPEKPTRLVGRDQETGETRGFSSFEVERMSAETFKRTFQLIGENRPAYLAARW